MKRFSRIILVGLLCLLPLGCGTAKKTWRDTKGLFKEYVDIDPKIDLSNPGIEDKSLQKLAWLFGPVDQKIENFLRELASQDSPPDAAWCDQLLSRYPWLAGIAVLDASGTVESQYPPVGLRNIDYAPLLGFEDRYKVRKLAAIVTTDDLGTIVSVAMPYYRENAWSGLLVASFDPRSLGEFCPEPNSLFVLYPEGVLWNGGDQAKAESMLAYAWKNELHDEVQGSVTVNGQHYAWQARWIGQLEIVYVTEGVAEQDESKAAPEAEAETEAAPEAKEAPPASEAVSPPEKPALPEAPGAQAAPEPTAALEKAKPAAPGKKSPTPSAQSAPSVGAAGEHVVRSGDVLSKIAKQYNVSVKAIVEANPGVDPDRLKVGQTIRIPAN